MFINLQMIEKLTIKHTFENLHCPYMSSCYDMSSCIICILYPHGLYYWSSNKFLICFMRKKMDDTKVSAYKASEFIKSVKKSKVTKTCTLTHLKGEKE